jgi:hypothetical protein
MSLGTLYKTVFKRNITYVTYVMVGAVVAESVWGKTFDAMWSASNQGKLYEHNDWSKWEFDWGDDEDEDEDDE